VVKIPHLGAVEIKRSIIAPLASKAAKGESRYKIRSIVFCG
jgi:hypothetical protein